MTHSRKVQRCRCGHAYGFHYFRTLGGKRKAACNHGDCRCKSFRPLNGEERDAQAARQRSR